mmetsp:Transcript_24547/g.38284  ORF Transcript_24547/g.38284 Transcript_24547/m.38284 type:complete len:292 (-) Transcript_24547:101-976(-)|eukprot:CAMPEP_0201539474 /NCGR_PEP_ID=MMETSP0161_2-20130828/70426_1 /ASSEMBLY_ACC=CAM_ASM_000251 /TAXON_ID=180227 /ORGANISM="Neoparamoeba aestuarina, Strain SoJaBio B1-5/56/2" /LENGTH=291 /DNA_ID=CAMNT_0047946873 /DNA_START=159 /DNA_END=1034 /DNA_ORIENTATION=+
MANNLFARACYDYHQPTKDDELEFRIGDIITVVSREGDRWLGTLYDRTGYFPSCYVSLISDDVDVEVVTQKILETDNQNKFDMVNGGIPLVTVKGLMTLKEFEIKYAEENGIDNPERLRWWTWMNRKNLTKRVQMMVRYKDTPLNALDFGGRNPILRLFVEISERPNPPFFDELYEDTIIIFFKYFDRENLILRHIGHGFFNRDDPVAAFTPVAKTLAGLSKNDRVTLYEEIKPLRIDRLETTKSIRDNELLKGDIIIVEKSFKEDLGIPRVPEFFRKSLDKSTNIKGGRR